MQTFLSKSGQESVKVFAPDVIRRRISQEVQQQAAAQQGPGFLGTILSPLLIPYRAATGATASVVEDTYFPRLAALVPPAFWLTNPLDAVRGAYRGVMGDVPPPTFYETLRRQGIESGLRLPEEGIVPTGLGAAGGAALGAALGSTILPGPGTILGGIGGGLLGGSYGKEFIGGSDILTGPIALGQEVLFDPLTYMGIPAGITAKGEAGLAVRKAISGVKLAEKASTRQGLKGLFKSSMEKSFGNLKKAISMHPDKARLAALKTAADAEDVGKILSEFKKVEDISPKLLGISGLKKAKQEIQRGLRRQPWEIVRNPITGNAIHPIEAITKAANYVAHIDRASVGKTLSALARVYKTAGFDADEAARIAKQKVKEPISTPSDAVAKSYDVVPPKKELETIVEVAPEEALKTLETVKKKTKQLTGGIADDELKKASETALNAYTIEESLEGLQKYYYLKRFGRKLPDKLNTKAWEDAGKQARKHLTRGAIKRAPYFKDIMKLSDDTASYFERYFGDFQSDISDFVAIVRTGTYKGKKLGPKQMNELIDDFANTRFFPEAPSKADLILTKDMIATKPYNAIPWEYKEPIYMYLIKQDPAASGALDALLASKKRFAVPTEDEITRILVDYIVGDRAGWKKWQNRIDSQVRLWMRAKYAAAHPEDIAFRTGLGIPEGLSKDQRVKFIKALVKVAKSDAVSDVNDISGLALSLGVKTGRNDQFSTLMALGGYSFNAPKAGPEVIAAKQALKPITAGSFAEKNIVPSIATDTGFKPIRDVSRGTFNKKISDATVKLIAGAKTELDLDERMTTLAELFKVYWIKRGIVKDLDNMSVATQSLARMLVDAGIVGGRTANVQKLSNREALEYMTNLLQNLQKQTGISMAKPMAQARKLMKLTKDIKPSDFKVKGKVQWKKYHKAVATDFMSNVKGGNEFLDSVKLSIQAALEQNSAFGARFSGKEPLTAIIQMGGLSPKHKLLQLAVGPDARNFSKNIWSYVDRVRKDLLTIAESFKKTMKPLSPEHKQLMDDQLARWKQLNPGVSTKAIGQQKRVIYDRTVKEEIARMVGDHELSIIESSMGNLELSMFDPKVVAHIPVDTPEARAIAMARQAYLREHDSLYSGMSKAVEQISADLQYVRNEIKEMTNLAAQLKKKGNTKAAKQAVTRSNALRKRMVQMHEADAKLKKGMSLFEAEADLTTEKALAGFSISNESELDTLVRQATYENEKHGITPFLHGLPKSPRFTTKRPVAAKPVPTTSHPMRYTMPKGSNIWDRETTTFDEIVAGNRVSTTRGWGKQLPKKGQIISFEKGGDKVVVRVTNVVPITDELLRDKAFQKQWVAKEGWKWDYAKNKGWIHGHQVEFELLPADIAQKTVQSAVDMTDAELDKLAAQAEEAAEGVPDLAGLKGMESVEGVPDLEGLGVTPVTDLKSKTGRPIAAGVTAEGEILYDKKKAIQDLKNKAWTKPKVEGVQALPADTFTKLSEYEKWLIEHEKAHLHPSIKAIEDEAARENAANYMALEKVFGKEKADDLIRTQTTALSSQLDESADAINDVITVSDVEKRQMADEFVEATTENPRDYDGGFFNRIGRWLNYASPLRIHETGDITPLGFFRDVRRIVSDDIITPFRRGPMKKTNRLREKLQKIVDAAHMDFKTGSREAAAVFDALKDERKIAQLPKKTQKHARKFREWYDLAIGEAQKEYDEALEFFMVGKSPNTLGVDLFKSLRGRKPKSLTEYKKWFEGFDMLGPRPERRANYVTYYQENKFGGLPGINQLLERARMRGNYPGFFKKRRGDKVAGDIFRAVEAYASPTLRYIENMKIVPALQQEAFDLSGRGQVLRSKYYHMLINTLRGDMGLEDQIALKILSGFPRLAKNKWVMDFFGAKPATALSQSATRLMYMNILGFQLGTPLRNLTQVLNQVALSGPIQVSRAMKALMDPEAIKHFKQVTNTENLRGVLERANPEKFAWRWNVLNKFEDLAFAPFNFSENMTRGVAFYSGAFDEMVKMGKKPTFEAFRNLTDKEMGRALTSALDAIDASMFIYDVTGRSPLFRTPLGRAIGQFMNYTIKQGEFIINDLLGAEEILQNAGLLKAGVKTKMLKKEISTRAPFLYLLVMGGAFVGLMEQLGLSFENPATEWTRFPVSPSSRLMKNLATGDTTRFWKEFNSSIFPGVAITKAKRHLIDYPAKKDRPITKNDFILSLNLFPARRRKSGKTKQASKGSKKETRRFKRRQVQGRTVLRTQRRSPGRKLSRQQQGKGQIRTKAGS